MTDPAILTALIPVIVLLLLGVVTAIASSMIRVSPIVGYIVLGLALKIAGPDLFGKPTIALLAELGVIFLLFDIGLNFSLGHVRKQASDIFAFGPVQILFSTVTLGIAAMAFGMRGLPALLVGAVLALSSTAVVGRLVAERHQRNCPVGLTATSILIFQDVAAILLLIVTGNVDGGGAIWIIALLALGKAVLAFGITVAVSRRLIGPLLALIARSRNDEVFTAAALLISLAAGWATGAMGLSLSFGAFLGGVALAETPYRALIESEIKPFRGLLLGFFFIWIGLSLDVDVLVQSLPLVIGLTILFIAIKGVSNVAASRVFRWSVPGSTQLGFLLAQGSEFTFVILSVPATRAVIGESRVSIIIAVTALSMAVTPNVAEAGRRLAGRMRRRSQKAMNAELTPQLAAAPVIIVGMGAIGRTIADGLIKFKIDYCAIERDQQRLQMAIADGYSAVFGDGDDMRLWKPFRFQERTLSVATKPDFDAMSRTNALARIDHPDLKRYAVVPLASEAERFATMGFKVVVDRDSLAGLDAAKAILAELGTPAAAIQAWAEVQTRLLDPVTARMKIAA